MAMATSTTLPTEGADKVLVLGIADERTVQEMANMLVPVKGPMPRHDPSIYAIARHLGLMSAEITKKVLAMPHESANMDRFALEFLGLNGNMWEDNDARFPIDSQDRNSTGPTGPAAPSMLERLFLNDDPNNIILPLLLHPLASCGPPGARSLESLRPHQTFICPGEQLALKVHQIWMVVVREAKEAGLSRETAPAANKYILTQVGPQDFMPAIAIVVAKTSTPVQPLIRLIMQSTEIMAQHIQWVYVLTVLTNPLKAWHMTEIIAESKHNMWEPNFPIALEPVSNLPANTVAPGDEHHPPIDTAQDTAPTCHPEETGNGTIQRHHGTCPIGAPNQCKGPLFCTK